MYIFFFAVNRKHALLKLMFYINLLLLRVQSSNLIAIVLKSILFREVDRHSLHPRRICPSPSLKKI